MSLAIGSADRQDVPAGLDDLGSGSACPRWEIRVNTMIINGKEVGRSLSGLVESWLTVSSLVVRVLVILYSK